MHSAAIKEIDTPSAGFWIGEDLAIREETAFEQHSAFFCSAAHVIRVQQVREIVEAFFPVRKNIYVTRRGNGGKPMTVIKVEDPNFPNHLTTAQKEELYYGPLREMNIEVRYSRNTNSYLHRVK